MRVHTTNRRECQPRVWQNDPTLDWRTCPGYQQHLENSEQERKHKLAKQIEEERKKTEQTKYSCENEEIDLPELEDQNDTTKTNNGQGAQQQNPPQPGTQTQQKDPTDDPMDETETPPQKRRLVETLQSGTKDNPENTQVPFVVAVKKPIHNTDARNSTATKAAAAAAPQGTRLEESGSVTIKTLREAWNMDTNPTDNQTAFNAAPSLRVKEMLESTHDQAARDMFSETQKALGKRTIIVDPEGLQQCITNIRESNQGKLLDSMGKEQDLLILGIWEYIWQWADRILLRVPQDVGEIYRRLECHGVETYILLKLKGTVELIRKHINLTHREQNTTNIQYNFNTLGLVRRAIPQYNKEGALKGATITLITNGGTFSTLEFLSNVQAASNALQRLTEQKTQCDPEQCPPEPLTSSGNLSDMPLMGRDFLLDLGIGRLLIKTEQTPAHTRASLNQGATFCQHVLCKQPRN